MKRCPECRRDYTDETLNYCLDDGAALLDGPGSGSEARTAIISGPDSVEDKKTAVMEGTTSDPSRSSATSSTSGKDGKGLFVFVGVILVGALIVVGWVIRKYVVSGDPDVPTFARFNLTKATTSGKAQEATISSDGKYIVYLEMSDDGYRSLWVKQMATGTAIPIVAPTKGNVLKGTTFSPDGNFVYYLFTDRTKPTSLHKVASLGGTPKKIADEVASAVAVSPDGERLAFTRYVSGRSELVTVKPDGSDEKILATLTGDEWLGDFGPSWSPDGKTIALTGGGRAANGPDSHRLIGVDTTDGSIRELSPKRWVNAGRVVWAPDGRSLIVIALESVGLEDWQVWQVNSPSGTATQITNDVLARDETSLGMTADGRTLLTVTVQRRSRIESIPANGDSERPVRLSRSETDIDGLEGLDVLADGRVVFASIEGGQTDIWIMNADGTARQRLTSDAFRDAGPSVSPDGRYVFFMSNRPTGDAVPRLWRMDIDGSNLVEIASRCESFSTVSSDSRSVAFVVTDETDKTRALMSVPVEGGQARRLTAYDIGDPVFSPDGKWIGAYYSDQTQSWGRYGIMPADGGEIVRDFEFPGFQYEWVRWTADSRHLSFIGSPPDPSNIWLQPIDGREARKLTDFETEYIYRHEWSLDGKTLFLVRGRPAFDVVLHTFAP